MQSLNEKVVWVTGASSGIGRSLALAAHRQSATVIASGRREDRLEALARECRGGAPIHTLPCDLTESRSLQEVTQAALRITGHIDVMVHNAGVAVRDLAVETAIEVDREVMETNYFGAVALTKALLPSMLARGSGTFLVVSSITGKYGVPRMGAYCASKHALHGYFESLRQEVRHRGLKVAIALPGFIDTPITENAFTGNGGRFARPLLVHRQGMSPDRCAQLIWRATMRGKEEFLVGGHEVLSVPLLRVSRRLVAAIIRNHPHRLEQRLRRWIDLRRPWRIERRGAEEIPMSW